MPRSWDDRLDDRILQLDTGQIEISARKIVQELQYDVTEMQRRVNQLEVAASDPQHGLPDHLPPPPFAAIEDVLPTLPLLLMNFRRTYLDALDQWASHMRDALGTYELVVNGLDQGAQAMVTLDRRDLIALPPGELPPTTN